nr:hypothetical protein [Tanacetum cinerariifolium]
MYSGEYLGNQCDPHLQKLLEKQKNPSDTIDPDERFLVEGDSFLIRSLGELLFQLEGLLVSTRTMATTLDQQVALDEALVPNAQREMLHISPRIPSQSFAELPFEEEILEFLRKPSIPRRNRVNWHYIRDDVLFSTIKVVSRHQTTQQYGVILPIELTNDDIRNSKAYKEYYSCATGEAAPKPKASAKKKTSGSASSITSPTPIATLTPTTTVVAAPRLSAAAKGKQPARATTPTDPTDVERTEAEQLKIVLKRSRQETPISQQHGSGTDEGTGSRPEVPDVPSDDSEEELSCNSFDDEDVDEQTKGREESEGDKTDESNDGDDEEETTKIGEQEVAESDEGDDEAIESDRESEDEETREHEEESFDPIPPTPEDNEDDDNNEEDQGLRIGEEERMQEEEDAEELYRDVDINQGRGLHVSQETEDTHVILTPTQSDAQQESSSTSSFMTNLLNPITDPGLESLFTTGSTTGTPIPLPQYTMTPSIISTFTSASQLPTSPTQIPKIFKALVEAYDADKTILDTYGESTILKRIREDDDQEGPSVGSDRGSKRQREGGEHASASTPSEPATESAGRSTTGSQSRQLSASKSALVEEPVQPTCQIEEPSHPVFKTAAQGEAQSWISALEKQTDARSSFNELLDTPIDFSNFIMNRLGVDTLTPELLAGPTYELIRGSCNSLTELKYHLEEVYKATTDQLDWVNPEGQQYPHNLLQPLPLIPDNRGRSVIPFEHFINNDLEYLRGGASSRKYTTSVTKTKAADYGHIKWIEDLVPRTMWIQEPISYDKHVLWGVS